LGGLGGAGLLAPAVNTTLLQVRAPLPFQLACMNILSIGRRWFLSLCVQLRRSSIWTYMYYLMKTMLLHKNEVS
jgi:hypothetical protein